MKNHVFLSHGGIVPPFPGFKSAKKSTANHATGIIGTATAESGAGSRDCQPSKLLSLVRAHEKKSEGSQDYEENIEEMVDLFNHLIAVYSRHGLLRGDSAKAEQILSTENSKAKPGDGRNRSGKKGKRGSRGNKSGDLRTRHLQNDTATPESSVSHQQDEALIFVAILRIFTSTPSVEESKEWSDKGVIDEDQALLTSLAAELCLAISQHIKVDKESDACSLAEGELLAQSGKAILTGLVNVMKLVLFDMRASSSYKKHIDCLTLLDCQEHTHALILNSSIKLTCSLVGLFGTKLSRSTALLLDLSNITWKLLTIDDDSVQTSAARLMSTLPLAGGIDGKSPSDIWSAKSRDTLTAISTVLQTVAPLSHSNTDSVQTSDLQFNDRTTNAFLEHWIQFVRRDISNEYFRLRCFYRFSRGLTKTFEFFLLQDPHLSKSTLVDVQLDIEKLLSVVESLVSLPLSSETVFYKTKRSLRDEKIDNGLLSPRIIATEVANHVKLMGHRILDSTLAVVGGPILLPYARRILRISYASVLTSSSSPVRKVVDPTSAVQLEGKKRRWLHLSIASRTVAVKTFGSAINAFGCDNTSNSRDISKTALTNSFIASTDSEKSITLVAGCLIEQLSRNRIQSGDGDDDWGTNLERVNLISESATCLSMSVVSCGGFLSMHIRSLIESVVVNALSQMCGNTQPSIQTLSWASVKVSFLQLACTCVTTPWQDGASSSLVHLLTITANRLKYDMDREVSSSANTALKFCDSIIAPRAPALTYVDRAVSTSNAQDTDPGPRATTTDATLLAAKIVSAQNDAAIERKKIAEIERTKKRKIDESRQREGKRNHEKVTKRQKDLEVKTAEKPEESRSKIRRGSIRGLIADKDETKLESKGKAHSTTPNSTTDAKEDKANTGAVAEERPGRSCNENNSEGQNNDGEQIETQAGEIRTDQKESGSYKNDSDDDAFPEIFDGGPDSDNE